MTDFDKKAREIVDKHLGTHGPFLGPAIAAALKAAYIQGYSDCDQVIADVVRAKKVTT